MISSLSFLWKIPLTYKTDASSTTHRHLMTTHTDSVHIGEEVRWMKVNTDMTRYYVVHDEDGGWDEMTRLLRDNHTALSFKDRTHFIHNAFQLITAGHLSLDTGLDLIGYLQLETHTVPLRHGLSYLEAFYQMIEKRNDVDVKSNLGIYILRFFRSIVDRQTWSDDGSASERRLRSKVLSLACHLEDPPCLERAKRSFKDWLRSNGTLGLLELGLEGKVVRSQDLASLITMVARNPWGHQLAWTFAKTNWDTLVQKFQLGSSCIRNILISTTGQFSSPEELTEVQLFFESIKDQASQLRAARVTLDNVQNNVRWFQKNLETLRSWLNKQLK
ncbi:endoplasmic reticulum aminopeptidase 2 [Pseudoliparis swirei]|uniref:endoplasmic reticulum aminopeptidase 2 n=1 Tax=Pseudoliparis swirei TaxID=2059687 RepID=UPI0024BE96F2|nr:endoplasmic reticulum aminopeptidase 2 [Pseudoliparis swirei]